MKKYTQHGIQLQAIKVAETTFIAYDLNFDEDGMKFPLRLNEGRTPYDREDRSIQIGLIGTLGIKKEDQEEGHSSPFFIRVELLGKFTVNPDEFPEDKVEEWAKINAPILLLPYLREHVYSLALRAGLPDLNLPLLNLPLYKLSQPKE